MELGSLPIWAQQLGGLLLTISTAIALTWNERRKSKRPSAEPGTAEVLAASVIDSRMLRELVNGAIDMGRVIERFREQQHDDSRALRAAIEEMTTELRRNTAAQDGGAITPRDLATLIGNLKGERP